ncbi:MAG: type IV pilus twitching motility protein PilT [Candidatus Eremiobacteraeota bacterium]|nr:type IV pilus twitching motility protein PilT [Candidatus Eremiobacteraeota bacterium]
MKAVDKYLDAMIKVSGSDLHLASGFCPMIRIHGQLELTDAPPLPPDNVREMALEILSNEDKEALFRNTSVDFIYRSEALGHRFRSNSFFQKNGLNLVFRWIPTAIPTLQSLGFPEVMRNLTHFHQGLVLVTGPSGCGKTSTLACLIDIINEERSLHIITVEDPIEYVHENKNSLVIQRQLGMHVSSFNLALKGALREDPDVIMIGEMRDLETIQLAITAAETGHLVFGTLNTNNAIQTIDRIIDAFPSDQQSQIRTMFSESIRGIVSQQLIPKADGTGRVCAYELLFSNPSVANMIRDGKNYQLTSVMQMGKKHGMQMMDISLRELLEQGLITRDEAFERCVDPQQFQ